MQLQLIIVAPLVFGVEVIHSDSHARAAFVGRAVVPNIWRRARSRQPHLALHVVPYPSAGRFSVAVITVRELRCCCDGAVTLQRHT